MTISDRMKSTLGFALQAEREHRHDFKIADTKGMFTNETRSPSLSDVEQYYISCRACGRSVFENGTGSARTGECGS